MADTEAEKYEVLSKIGTSERDIDVSWHGMDAREEEGWCVCVRVQWG